MPAEISSVIASSTLMSSSTMSLRGRKKKKPVVGFGVHGRKTEICSASGNRAATLSLGGCDTNTSDHIPGAGNSTSPTVRKVEPDCENTVSKICFIVL